jgi:hypothetical protein
MTITPRLEARGGHQQIGVHPHAAADDERIVLGEHLAQLLARRTAN